MALTLLYIYNKVAGQAWSKFDGDAESGDEFEENLLSSIQKALSSLWGSSPFPFRIKEKNAVVSPDNNTIRMPDGDIHKKTINGDEKYSVRVVGGNYLDYLDDYEILPEKKGKPEGFYIKNEKIYIYPEPDKEYQIKTEYLTLIVGFDKNKNPVFQLVNDTDYIDIPKKYESLFLNALITLSMCYAIAADGDENYSNYYAQYQSAYRLLQKYTKCINVNKRVSW